MDTERILGQNEDIKEEEEGEEDNPPKRKFNKDRLK
jgi:hypothetical protein